MASRVVMRWTRAAARTRSALCTSSKRGSLSEPAGVERAPLVRDQHDPLQPVFLRQELEFIDDAHLLQVRLRMSRQARRATGQRDAVVAGEREAVLQEVVKALAHAAVRAIQSGGVDAELLLPDGALVLRAQLRARRPLSGRRRGRRARAE